MRNIWLIAAGAMSAIASVLHIGVILGGASWYRFFGAGEDMARAAERGSVVPGLVTLVIALVLSIWAVYAFSAAGLLRRLPLMRTALIVITGIYLLRGIALLPLLAFRPALVDTFTVASSLIVLAYGIVHAIGTWQAWPNLRPAQSADRHG